MDKLSIFSRDRGISGDVTISSSSGNTLDSVIAKLETMINEAKLLRAGHEEWTWGQLVKESDIDLEDLGLSMEVNDG